MDGANERNERALRAYLGLIRAAESVTGLLEMQLESMRLTLSQGRVLEALMKFGPLSHLSLARKILRSKSAVGLMVKELEKRRLIVSRTDKRDRRKQIARVTLKGNKLASELVPVHTRLIRAQMATLGGREQETLARLCEKLIAGDSTKFASEFVQAEANG
ncbi:MAG TPA: MarR family transcriptional regulator [Candidatus Acidoferrales bacterium]|jgi:DNA-binding MarR family transcriptional regulator|nr:MarR family transcriptional regulator [Candidatus Acidoferrales bacterium]